MSRVRILALFGDGGQQAGTVSVGERHELVFSAHGFDTLVSWTGREDLSVNRAALDAAIDEMAPFDAVFCDSPEAVLLHFVRTQRGLRPLPFLINEVDGLRTARAVQRLVLRHYRCDPLPPALADPRLLWFSILPDPGTAGAGLGLPADRLVYLPMARSSVAFFFPDLVARQDDLIARLGDRAPDPDDRILGLGSHERDWACLDAALRATGLTADVIGNVADRPAGPIRWLGSQPPGDYLWSIAAAGIVVIPLRDAGRAAGQLSCALPMRLGKALVATTVPSLAAHVRPGVTGLGYPLGDAEALGNALLRLARDPALRRSLGQAAREQEARLSAAAAAGVERMLDHLDRWRSG